MIYLDVDLNVVFISQALLYFSETMWGAFPIPEALNGNKEEFDAVSFGDCPHPNFITDLSESN